MAAPNTDAQNSPARAIERNGIPTSDATTKTLLDLERAARPQGDDATTGAAPPDRAPDEDQAAPVAREAAPAGVAAPNTDAARNSPASAIERNGLPTSDATTKTLLDLERDARPQEDDATPAGAPPDRAPEEDQAAPVEREAAPPSGVAPVDRSARAGENTPPLLVERNGAATSDAVTKTPLDQDRGLPLLGDDATNAPPADRASDEVQAAPVEREAGPTVGVASFGRSADAAEKTPRPVIDGRPISRSLDALAIVMVMVVAALALIRVLFRRTYGKRLSAFRAMRRSQRPADHVRPVDLPSRPRQQAEVDPASSLASVKSSLDSVKKALDEIDEATAEMASTREFAVGSLRAREAGSGAQQLHRSRV